MKCHEYESAIVDLARGVPRQPAGDAALHGHLEECRECTARLARERALTAGLRGLAASTEIPDGTALEARLLVQFDREVVVIADRAGSSQRWFAAAAVLVMVVGLAAAWRTVRSQPAANDAYTVAEDAPSEFVPWPGAAALPAFESGQLVRTELPASVLPLLGISRADAPADGHVTADVLYGQDGLARAVRLVRVQSTRLVSRP